MFAKSVYAGWILISLFMVEFSAAQDHGMSVQVSAPASVAGRSISSIQVTIRITNTDTTALTLLNDPTSALTNFPTNIFKMTNNDNNNLQPQFIGTTVKFAPQVAVAKDIVTSLAPGATVEVMYDLAQAYNFTASGLGSYTINISPIFQALDAKNQILTITASASSASMTLADEIAHARVGVNTTTPDITAPIRLLAKRASFVGCSSAQQSQINQAASAAQNYASQAFSYANANVAKNTNRFRTWFGAPDANRYKTVVQHFKNINGNNFGTYTYDCTCNSQDTYAYVYPSRSGKVYLCGAFFNAPLTGTDSKGGTLIHESSHFASNAGTQDHAYGQSACKNLAKSNPSQAIDNADSHEYFAENNPSMS